MKFKPYATYEASGVEWLGTVPTGWPIHRLKWTVEACRNGVWGDEPNGDDDIICIRVADFDRNRNRVDEGPYTTRSIPANQLGNRVLKSGDLLIEKSGGGEQQPVGVVVLFDKAFPAVCSNFVARMPVKPNHDSNYLTYLHAAIYAIRLNTCSIKQNTGIQNLDAAAYLDERAALPALSIQQSIATFLDRETAKIDTLITKHEKLIELLQEKRQAVISHAVTKGLDPNVPMKESGVQWLEEVPEHWTVCQIKRLLLSSDYGISTALETTGDIPILRMGNIVDGQVSMADLKFTDELAADLRLSPQDILFNRTNSLVLVGKVGMYKGSAYDEVGFASYLVRLRVNGKALASYLTLLLNSDFVLQRARADSIPAIGQANLNPTRYGTIRIPVPPLDEQRVILAYLDKTTTQIDLLVKKAKQAIELQKEHRTALISAAVTGMIDVREWAREKLIVEKAA